MLILWIHKYLIQISMTSKVIKGHKSSFNFSVNPTLPNTFLYESILIKFIWMLILWINKYFIKISMTSKVIEGHKSSSNFSVNLTFPLIDGPLMLPYPNCGDLSLSLSESFLLHLMQIYGCFRPCLFHNSKCLICHHK